VVGRINQIQNSIAISIEGHTAASNEIARNLRETGAGTAEIAGNIGGWRKVRSRPATRLPERSSWRGS
jgi:hypothetical protein